MFQAKIKDNRSGTIHIIEFPLRLMAEAYISNENIHFGKQYELIN